MKDEILNLKNAYANFMDVFLPIASKYMIRVSVSPTLKYTCVDETEHTICEILGMMMSMMITHPFYISTATLNCVCDSIKSAALDKEAEIDEEFISNILCKEGVPVVQKANELCMEIRKLYIKFCEDYFGATDGRKNK